MLERRTFAPLRSHTLRGNIVELLTEAILEGKIKPGQRLNETQLARELRVSRAPIREALHQLQERGLVENSPRRGMFVVSLDEEDVQKINGLRVILEAEALRLCRSNLTLEGEKRLVQLVQKMERIEPEWASPSAARLDLDFHRTVWSFTGNQYLQRILDSITTPLFAHIVITSQKNEKLRLVIPSHRPLLEFLQGKSKQSAEEAILEHLKKRWSIAGARKGRALH